MKLKEYIVPQIDPKVGDSYSILMSDSQIVKAAIRLCKRVYRPNRKWSLYVYFITMKKNMRNLRNVTCLMSFERLLSQNIVADEFIDIFISNLWSVFFYIVIYEKVSIFVDETLLEMQSLSSNYRRIFNGPILKGR